MAESHVVSGLVAKRSELSGLLTHHQEVIRQLSISIGNIDGSIKLFDPDYDLRTIKAKAPRQANYWFDHGEVPGMILDAFRIADSQLTTRQISEQLLAKVGKQPDNQKDWDSVLKIIHAALTRMAKGGSVRCAGKSAGLRNAPHLWELA
jgi:hypothetical protein